MAESHQNVPYPPDALLWPDTTPPMLKEEFCYHYTNIKYADIEYSDDNSVEVSQDGKDSEDEASQDDEEDGEVEPDEMEENGTLAAAMAMLDMTEDDLGNLEEF